MWVRAVMYGSRHCGVSWTEIDRMNTQFPTPEDRKRLLQSFYGLSPRDLVSLGQSCKLNLGFTA